MTTYRPSHRDRFVIVDRTVTSDPRLSFKALGLLVWLLDKPDTWRVDAAAIARDRVDGRTAVLSALHELEVAGYIVRERHQVDGRWTSTTDVHEIPEVGKPDSGSPDVGSPDALQGTRPTTEKLAAADGLSTPVDDAVEEALSLDLSASTPGPVQIACQAAAEHSGAQERAAGRRIGHLRNWAKPRARDYLDRYLDDLTAMAAAGATVEDLTAWIIEAETALIPPVRLVPEPARPSLPPFQASFEDTDVWRADQPVDLEARRAVHTAGLDAARSSLRRGTSTTP